MNKTLLLILCDFLLLNLLALTRWEKAEPTRAKQPPVPELAANAATKDQDLVAAMQASLADEQASRTQLAQQLSSTTQTLAQREQSVAVLAAEKTQLSVSLASTQETAADLGRKVSAATQDAALTKEQLAKLQRELDEKRAETARQQAALAALEKLQAEARQKIEGLTVAVKVAEQEKVMLKENADTFKQQAAAERAEREKVTATTVQLAAGVGQLAENSGALTKEIRDNRPINANVLFNDFLTNRVMTKFTAVRAGLFSPATREKETGTIFVSDGAKIFALLHVADTPFPPAEFNYDWDKLTAEFSRPPAYRSRAGELRFLAADPRVIVLPVEAAQVAALGVRVYPLAAEPFKFPEAVLVSGGGKGYGEVAFKLDASQPGYVRVDNRLFKRLFGDFAPSRGDLVFSKTGELLGIMANADYCAVLKDFTAVKTLATGDDVRAQHTGALLNEIFARLQAMTPKLQ